MNIQYAVLRYRPDLYSGESLNVGVVYHNLTTGERDFKLMKNFNRLWSFDDELDPEFTFDSIEAFKNDWLTGNLLNNYTKLKDYTKFFVNEFYFGKIKDEKTENYSEFIQSSSKFFLRRGLPSNERLNKSQNLRFIETFLKANSLEFQKNKAIKGYYNDSYTFDYYVTNSNSNTKMGVKYISSSVQSVNSIRSLLFYAEHNPSKKISIILDRDSSYDKNGIENLLEFGRKEKLISIINQDKIDEILSV